MSDQPRVILSGFADEAANHKTAMEQFAAFAAIGLEYYSLRFVDVGSGIKNVMQLTKSEITKLRHLEDEYGMNVASIGSPIGKVKLLDTDDGTKNRYVPFKRYMKSEVKKACDLAHAFETKLIRGFSFYHPKGTDPREHLNQAADQLGEIAELCHRSDLTFGLEVEANLIGQTGELLAELHRKVNHPAMVTIFDGGNLVSQGMSTDEVFQEYLAMKPSLGWMHIKDYRDPSLTGKADHVEEDKLKNFVPADMGDSGHTRILEDFKEVLPKLTRKLKRRGIPGVFLELEPHLKGGGQFGGFSGPDGMGVALRGLRRVLDFVGIEYDIRGWDDVVASRGF
ncbi:sugar phosphate isomerase/epimerase [Aeoliella sp. ICT_H6.2]|uniref:Sugar phosphate isomerase/epimerase n=1 Tax=Aeoliella straminimaris TaxID=2954799 RepID=A0A9X2JIA4_9BACT|nr:sugar phosphate isomerase/epimerase family protein [Aeoliella straminimaris]MCO6045493.1 sugar phosphate isomerase/epimerase [Aeoliella straminimaris]